MIEFLSATSPVNILTRFLFEETFDDNEIEALLESQFREFERLNISIGMIICNDNYLTRIPENLQLFQHNLRKLVFNRNILKLGTEFPSSFFDLTHLIDLNIQYNGFESIPADINNFIELESLYLEGNPLKKISPLYLPRLNNIDLEFICNDINIINNLIHSFIQCQNVHDIYLSFNKIKEIPTEIYIFPNLRYLDMNCCEIEILPKELLKIESLEEISVVNNKIQEIPDGFERFRIGLDENPLYSLKNIQKESLDDLLNNTALFRIKTRLPKRIRNLSRNHTPNDLDEIYNYYKPSLFEIIQKIKDRNQYTEIERERIIHEGRYNPVIIQLIKELPFREFDRYLLPKIKLRKYKILL